MNAKEIINAASAVIESKPTRSAWKRGVKAYALELLENLAELNADQFADPTAVRAALLNGAQIWKQYSWGGCALIRNRDIAALPPSTSAATTANATPTAAKPGLTSRRGHSRRRRGSSARQ